MTTQDFSSALRAGMDFDKPPDWKRHALRLTAFPPEGPPYTSFELVSEFTGEILLSGEWPVDQEVIRSACAEYHEKLDAQAS